MKKTILYFSSILIVQPVIAIELFRADGFVKAPISAAAQECRTFLTGAATACTNTARSGRLIAGQTEKSADSAKKQSSPIFAILYIPPSDYSSLSPKLDFARNTLEQTLNGAPAPAGGERTANNAGAMWGIGAYIPFK